MTPLHCPARDTGACCSRWHPHRQRPAAPEGPQEPPHCHPPSRSQNNRRQATVRQLAPETMQGGAKGGPPAKPRQNRGKAPRGPPAKGQGSEVKGKGHKGKSGRSNRQIVDSAEDKNKNTETKDQKLT